MKTKNGSDKSNDKGNCSYRAEAGKVLHSTHCDKAVMNGGTRSYVAG
jgi:hypothetical protein